MQKPRTNYYPRYTRRVSYKSHARKGWSRWDTVILIGIVMFIAIIFWAASQDAAFMVKFLSK